MQFIDIIGETKDRPVLIIKPLTDDGGADEGPGITCIGDNDLLLFTASIAIAFITVEDNLVLDLHINFVQPYGICAKLTGFPLDGAENLSQVKVNVLVITIHRIRDA